MEPRTITSSELGRAFIFATDWLGVYIESVNALNVYPVPDGDTGTNMHLTMQSVRRQIQNEEPANMKQLAHAISYGSLLGARGNSGVILSQILKGFADVVRSHEQLDGDAIKRSLGNASKVADAAVMTPDQGTSRTGIRQRPAGARGRHGERHPE